MATMAEAAAVSSTKRRRVSLRMGAPPWVRRAGGCSIIGETADAIVADPASIARREITPVRSSPIGDRCALFSHPENPGVARLDLLAGPVDVERVLLHQLDVGERLWPGLCRGGGGA